MDTGGIRVLMVDDDEDEYVLTRDLLADIEANSHQLEWAPTYDAGLEAALQADYDVVLVDYRLDSRNGLELIRDAFRAGCRVPMILMTGQGDHDLDIAAMRAGADDYLDKSKLDPLLLERAIRYSMERSRAEQERSVLEQQLRQSQKMEAVGQLAGGIAHDFNNLLTAIMGYTQLGVNMVVPGGNLQSHFMEIQKAAQLAADLTRKLLAVSRRQILEQRDLNLNALLIDTHKMLRRMIGEDIELVTVTAQDLGMVRVDPGHIEQVMMNIAINARDAMEGGGKLTIETANAELDETYAGQHADVEPGPYVLLSVTDTGTGMTEDVQAQMFDPFFTTKEPGKGTGLGLSTCYGIVKQNGGHISVYSERAKGTTFKIYLPRVDGTDYSLEQKEEVAPSLPKGRENVLLVEDEETVRGMAARVLREQGYTVVEAENGGDALRVAEEFGEQSIDLLLTDIVMPLMGGRELASQLVARSAVSRVLYTSGYTDAAVVQDGALEPGVKFLPKPFTPDALARQVREALDTP